MAELLFKRGTQAALASVTPQDGTFYLTTDTGRMYAGITLPGQTTAKLVELNQSITPVNTVDDLPKTNVAAGQFYYVKGTGDANAKNTHKGNILAFYDGSNWVQINPDTDHYLKPNTQTTTVGATTGTSNSVTVTNTVQDTLNGTLGLNAAVGSFSIEGNDNIAVTFDATNRKIKLAVAAGALYGLDAETVTRQDSKTEVAVNLIKNPGTGQSVADTVNIVSGNNTKVSVDSDGKIIVDTKNALGIKEFTIAKNTVANKGGYDFTIKNDYGTPFTQNLQIPIELQGTAGDETVNIVDGKYDLPVYTAGQTDAKISAAVESAMRTADALTYIGVVGTGAEVTALKGKVHNGDVYKVSANITTGISGLTEADEGTNITSLDAGDLIIFTGAENASGLMTGFTAKVIPSGDDQVVKFEIDATNNTIKSYDNLAKANGNGLHLVGSTYIDVSSAEETVGTSKVMKTTLTHKDVTRTNSTGDSVIVQYDTASTTGATKSATISVVESVTSDGKGHVTDVKTKSVKITDSHNDVHTVRNVVANVTNDDTAVSVTTGVSTTDRSTVFKEGSFNIKGIGNVVARADGSNVKVSLEWGSF